jgi:hypothetical protein
MTGKPQFEHKNPRFLGKLQGLGERFAPMPGAVVQCGRRRLCVRDRMECRIRAELRERSVRGAAGPVGPEGSTVRQMEFWQ